MPFDQTDWDAICKALYEGTLIPIVGRELTALPNPGDQQPIPFELHLARTFAAAEPEPLTIRATESAACFYARNRRYFADEPRAETRLAAAHENLLPASPLPAGLAPLLAGGRTRLWLTTSTDGLLHRALREEAAKLRPPPPVQEHAAHRRQPANLPEFWHASDGLHLLYLFGRINTEGASYCRTDADMLEYLIELAAPEYRPANLFAALSGKGLDRRDPAKPVPTHLLFLGHSFPDWLARLFHRTLRGIAYTDPQVREGRETIVDSEFMGEPEGNSLVFFFHHFCRATARYPGSVAQFLSDLATHWQAYLEKKEAPPEGVSQKDYAMEPGSVFISYTRDDADAAKAVHQQLTAAKINAWFDQARLSTGTAWSNAIEENIAACDLFIPLLSSHTERKGAENGPGGYFLEEWRLGLARTLRFGKGRPFICPLMVEPGKMATDFPNAGKRLEPRLPPLSDWQFAPAPGGLLDSVLRDEHGNERLNDKGEPLTVLREIIARLKQVRT